MNTTCFVFVSRIRPNIFWTDYLLGQSNGKDPHAKHNKVDMPISDTLFAPPTSNKIWDMQLVQDD